MAGWGRCRDCHGRIWFGTSPYNASKVLPFDAEDEQLLHFETCVAAEYFEDVRGESHRVSPCKACGARVWWQTTPNGKRRPMDADEAAECHFDTCPGETPDQAARHEHEQHTRNRQQADRQRRKRYASETAPYEIRLWLPDLELTWPCAFSEVTSNFRKLAMRHHPDMGGTSAEFIRIRLAYDRLRQLAELFPEEVMA